MEKVEVKNKKDPAWVIWHLWIFFSLVKKKKLVIREF